MIRALNSIGIHDGSFLYRKKQIDDDRLEETKLNRVLNTLDLTALGCGNYFRKYIEIIYFFFI